MNIDSITSSVNSSSQVSSGNDVDVEINQLSAQEKDIKKQISDAKNDKTLSSSEKDKKVAELQRSLEQIEAEISQLKNNKTKSGSQKTENKESKNEINKKDNIQAYNTGVGTVVDENM